MNSLRLRFYSLWTRCFIKPWVKRQTDPQTVRDSLESHAKRTHFHPTYVVYRNGKIGGVPVKWASRKAAIRDDVLFYVHGGGFVVGSPDTHKHMVAKIAGDLGIEAIMPYYRLAPENRFPAGFDDIVAAYEGLIASGRRADQIIVGGDSAGGNLVLSLLAYLSDRKQPLPQSAFVLSPVVDMSGGFDSLKENANSEVLLSADRFNEMSEMYLGNQNRSHPYASPYYAEFERLPPILFHCCEGEILRDDTLEMQRKLVARGHDVLVRTWPNAFHVFHLLWGHFPEASAGLEDVVSFIQSHRPPNDS